MPVCIPGCAATCLLYSVGRSFSYVVHSWPSITLIVDCLDRSSITWLSITWMSITLVDRWSLYSSIALIFNHFNRRSLPIVNHHPWSSITILDCRSPSSIVDHHLRSSITILDRRSPSLIVDHLPGSLSPWSLVVFITLTTPYVLDLVILTIDLGKKTWYLISVLLSLIANQSFSTISRSFRSINPSITSDS